MLKVGLIALSLAPSIDACPGSASAVHAKCEMNLKFTNQCDAVMTEISGRLTSSTWVDPHNGGTYSLTSSNSSYISGQRITGDKKYTDKFDFFFAKSGTGCLVNSCSESQVFSITDYSTNYCNLHDLYCSSTDGCPTIGKDLTYTETYTSCTQHDSVCVTKAFAFGKPNKQCFGDIQKVVADIHDSRVAITDAVSDCKDGYTSACDQDIDNTLTALTNAASDLTQAIYDCSGTEPTPCSDDINAVIADITTATIYITDAVVDCQADKAKCREDISAATKSVVQAGIDIAKSVSDCRQ